MLILFMAPAPLPFSTQTSYAGIATKTQIPDFYAVTQWLNTEQTVTRKSLEGNVVVISFWNFSCLECMKQLVVLDSWQRKYETNRFKVITIHTPFYAFEKFPENVEAAVKKLGFPMAVGLDPDGLMWQAYNRPARPVYYFVDSRGRIRGSSPENPDYAKEEAILQDLLREQGEEIFDEIEVKTKRKSVATGRISFGFQDLSRYGNETKTRAEIPLVLKNTTGEMRTGYFYLSGKWNFHQDSVSAVTAKSELAIPFQGSRIYLIAGSPRNNPIRLQIAVDGQVLTKQTLGRDAKIDRGDAYVEIKDDGPYEVAKNLELGADRHLLEIVFEDPDAILYAAEFD